jgi:hypothetical protein
MAELRRSHVGIFKGEPARVYIGPSPRVRTRTHAPRTMESELHACAHCEQELATVDNYCAICSEMLQNAAPDDYWESDTEDFADWTMQGSPKRKMVVRAEDNTVAAAYGGGGPAQPSSRTRSYEFVTRIANAAELHAVFDQNQKWIHHLRPAVDIGIHWVTPVDGHLHGKYAFNAHRTVKRVWPEPGPAGGSGFVLSQLLRAKLFSTESENNWANYFLVDPIHDGNCGTHILAVIATKSLVDVNRGYTALIPNYMLPKGKVVDRMMVALYTVETLGMGILIIRMSANKTCSVELFVPAPGNQPTLVLMHGKDAANHNHFVAISADATTTTMTPGQFDTFHASLSPMHRPDVVTSAYIRAKLSAAFMRPPLADAESVWKKSWVPGRRKRVADFELLLTILSRPRGPFSINFGEQHFDVGQCKRLTATLKTSRVCFGWFDTNHYPGPQITEWYDICSRNKQRVYAQCLRTNTDVPWLKHFSPVTNASEYWPARREDVNEWLEKDVPARQHRKNMWNLEEQAKYADDVADHDADDSDSDGDDSDSDADDSDSEGEEGADEDWLHEDRTSITVQQGAFTPEEVERLYTEEIINNDILVWPGFDVFIQWAKKLQSETVAGQDVSMSNIQQAKSKSRASGEGNFRAWIGEFVNRSANPVRGTKWDFILTEDATTAVQSILTDIDSPSFNAKYAQLTAQSRHQMWQFHVTLSEDPLASVAHQSAHQDDPTAGYSTLMIPLTLDDPSLAADGFPSGGGTAFPRQYTTTTTGDVTTYALASGIAAQPIVVNPYGGFVWFTGAAVHFGVANTSQKARVFLAISFYNTDVDPNRPDVNRSASEASEASGEEDFFVAFGDFAV